MTSLPKKRSFCSWCSPRHCFRAKGGIAGRFHPAGGKPAHLQPRLPAGPLLAAMASPLAEYEVCLGFDSPLITPGGNLLNASNDHRLILLSPACLPSSSPPPFLFSFPLIGHASLLRCLPKQPS